MKKINFNILNFKNEKIGSNRIDQIINDLFSSSNVLPKPVTQNEIHDSMVDFVNNKLSTTYNGVIVPAFYLNQQRFSEFSKTWEYADENKNILSNFIIITRENNPKKGTIYGDLNNIPGNDFYTIGTSEKFISGKNILISYKMKQPYAVDYIYEIKIISNKLDLLNIFNNKLNNEFKALQSYISPNGHYMPIKLEDISDESDYELDERKVFMQTFSLRVMGYVINEEDLIIEENISTSIMNFEIDNSGGKNKSTISNGENINIDFLIGSKNIIVLKSDAYYSIDSIVVNNISDCEISVNGIIVNNSFELKKYDKISVKINKINVSKHAKVVLNIV